MKHPLTSYSVYIDKKSENKYEGPLNYVLPKKNIVWIDDNSVTKCFDCKYTFGLTLRKHHCRSCGRIFCYKCSNNWTKIPSIIKSSYYEETTWNDYAKYYFSKNSDKMRVCNDCYKLITKINEINKIITIILDLPVTVFEYKILAQINKKWNQASNYCLTLFKDIQYKLPSDKYSKHEKRMLWRNLHFFSEHGRYLFHAIKITKNKAQVDEIIKIINGEKCVSCWSLMCSKSCKLEITCQDAIVILDLIYRRKVRNGHVVKLALQFLDNYTSDKELLCYMPFLVYNIRNDTDDLLSEFLLNKALENNLIMNSLYWELQMYPEDRYHLEHYKKLLNSIQDKLKADQNEDILIKLLQSYSFSKTIENISNEIWMNHKKYNDIRYEFIMEYSSTIPLDISIEIQDILLDEIKMKDSASKPLLIPCVKSNGETYNILYKNDDIRKDQTIINIIRLVDIFVERDEGIKLNTKTYDVLPTGKNKGFIEIIDNAETIYTIKEKMQTTILNYILEDNEKSMTIRKIRKRLIKSIAVYCVISYLIGIGDRHLDNIMVSKDAHLFHIDFGYIIGEDPKFREPGIRITHDMINSIGGPQSKYYEEFKDLCNVIFNCMRINIDIFIVLLTILSKTSNITLTEQEIRERIIKKFAPGETYEEANLHLVNQLETTSYTHQIIDFCHYHSKEKTLNSVTETLSSALYSLTSYFY